MASEENKINLWVCFGAAILILAITDGLFIPLMVYRICYQSTSTYVPSQCVNCPFLALQGYSFSCIGSTAFPRNITPSQAQCMIQRCQEGIRQTPVYLGRKKRMSEHDDDTEDIETVEDNSTIAGNKSENQSSSSVIKSNHTNKSDEEEQKVEVISEIEIFVSSDFDSEDYEI